MVTMGNRDCVYFRALRFAEERQSFASLALGMHAGIQQNPVVTQFHQPRACANVGVRIQIRDIHTQMLTIVELRWT
jgi:hypothetical protein